MTTLIPGIIAFVKAVPVIDSWVQQIIAAYIMSCQRTTLTKIVDAAAMGARATNDEERYQAASAWVDALKRERVSV